MNRPGLSANRIVLLSFAGDILLSTVLLKLPVSAPGGISWLDALFGATSAVTVTGLQVVDPPRDFGVFGQGVLAVLMQVGGLGIVTVATIGVALIGGTRATRSSWPPTTRRTSPEARGASGV